jgi:DNA-directed RNA polymerase subunit M/transcription elongation factor TFIIS
MTKPNPAFDQMADAVAKDITAFDPSATTAYCPHCGECLFPKPDQWGDIIECGTTGKAFRLVPESRLPNTRVSEPLRGADTEDSEVGCPKCVN